MRAWISQICPARVVNCHGWLRTGLTGLLLLVELPVLAGPF